jgi:SH3-like domain-containing protein
VGGVVLGARVVVEHMREGVVQKPEVSARKEPDAAAAEAFVAHAGLSGEIVDEQGGYARMRFENGLEAWLPVDALAVLESL